MAAFDDQFSTCLETQMAAAAPGRHLSVDLVNANKKIDQALAKRNVVRQNANQKNEEQGEGTSFSE